MAGRLKKNTQEEENCTAGTTCLVAREADSRAVGRHRRPHGKRGNMAASPSKPPAGAIGFVKALNPFRVESRELAG